MQTLRVRKIPYRLPCWDEVTKRIDLFKLEQHLARSQQRTEVTPVLIAADDDFDTRVTMPREVVLPPPMPPVYPVKRQDPTELLVIFVLLCAISALVSLLIY